MESHKPPTARFIKKMMIKTLMFIVAMIIISAISQSIAPVISNDIAMGQLENYDELYVMMETYNKLKPLVNLAYVSVIAWFAAVIVGDIKKFIKTAKSDNTQPT